MIIDRSQINCAIFRIIEKYALRVSPAETWLTVYRRLQVGNFGRKFDFSIMFDHSFSMK